MRIEYGKVAPEGMKALPTLGKYAQDSAFCLEIHAFCRESGA